MRPGLTLIYLSWARDYLALITEYYWPLSNNEVKMDGEMNDRRLLRAPAPPVSVLSMSDRIVFH